MHSYLGAVGFKEIQNIKEVRKLIEKVIKDPDERRMIHLGNGDNIVEIKKEFMDGMGIIVHGYMDEEDEFNIEYYYPYIMGDYAQPGEDVVVEKHISKNSHSCISEDLRVGVSLIYYLQNNLDYVNLSEEGRKLKKRYPVRFAALSMNGTILLPIRKTESDKRKDKVALKNRKNLLKAAKNGDPDAMESLTIEDIDTYTKISRRILKEDVFSIVDSSFMPYGVECDLYTVVADIVDVKSIVSPETKEEVYKIHLNCNELLFTVGINKKDLLGEPEPGRRFKGSIWLQGTVDFNE
ncbi:DUF3881 family protein [Parasporobacterium paucivorans]|uniref:Uncharacterized protein n=1 Tax=Parasporobacterium paucivorans DSM 15970 TaxID=1122934 RepID=A0A1M6B8X7_9FIRM|nr:DUF3881 family protein [Parasporobacterium paucivorans]SHI45028.1 protein of unknown function [Parasporobacterium paucivorans DSM 15970]